MAQTVTTLSKYKLSTHHEITKPVKQTLSDYFKSSIDADLDARNDHDCNSDTTNSTADETDMGVVPLESSTLDIQSVRRNVTSYSCIYKLIKLFIITLQKFYYPEIATQGENHIISIDHFDVENAIIFFWTNYIRAMKSNSLFACDKSCCSCSTFVAKLSTAHNRKKLMETTLEKRPSPCGCDNDHIINVSLAESLTNNLTDCHTGNGKLVRSACNLDFEKHSMQLNTESVKNVIQIKDSPELCVSLLIQVSAYFRYLLTQSSKCCPNYYYSKFICEERNFCQSMMMLSESASEIDRSNEINENSNKIIKVLTSEESLNTDEKHLANELISVVNRGFCINKLAGDKDSVVIDPLVDLNDNGSHGVETFILQKDSFLGGTSDITSSANSNQLSQSSNKVSSVYSCKSILKQNGSNNETDLEYPKTHATAVGTGIKPGSKSAVDNSINNLRSSLNIVTEFPEKHHLNWIINDFSSFRYVALCSNVPPLKSVFFGSSGITCNLHLAGPKKAVCLEVCLPQVLQNGRSSITINVQITTGLKKPAFCYKKVFETSKTKTLKSIPIILSRKSWFGSHKCSHLVKDNALNLNISLELLHHNSSAFCTQFSKDYKPITDQRRLINELHEYLSLVQSERVMVKVGTAYIECCRTLLCARATRFQELLNDNPTVVEIKDLTTVAASNLLSFIQQDCCTLLEDVKSPCSSLLELLAAAYKYDCKSLFELLVPRITSFMSIDNILLIRKIALACGEHNSLLQACTEFLNTLPGSKVAELLV